MHRHLVHEATVSAQENLDVWDFEILGSIVTWQDASLIDAFHTLVKVCILKLDIITL